MFPVTVSICRIANDENNGGGINTYNNNYALFPNPTSGLIKLQQTVPEDLTATIRISNYIGQTVYSGDMVFSQGTSQVYLNNVDAGVYIIELIDGKGQKGMFRLVVEK